MRLDPSVTLGAAAPDGNDVLRSPVLSNGRSTGLTVSGTVLEAALAGPNGTLLFVTYGDPFEDSLEINFAKPDWQRADWAQLGMSGAGGAFRDLAIENAHQVRFTFFGDNPWRLTLHPEPRLALPLGALGLAVQRPFQLQRFFSLSRL